MSEIPERWPPDLVMKCLEYYYRFPCLWDVDSIDYKNKQKRERAINEMAICFNMSSEMMKKKLHSLRNAYINEVAKINRSIESGDVAYVPKLSWYKFADSFLGKVVRRKKPNLICESPLELKLNQRFKKLITLQRQKLNNKEEMDNTLSQISWEMPKKNVLLSRLKKQLENIQEPEIELSVGSSSSPPPTEHSSHLTYTIKKNTKRQKLGPEPSGLASDLLLQETVCALKNLSSSLIADKNDEIIAFGQSVIAQLGKLPEEYQIECMSEIQSIITLSRLKYLRSKPNRVFESE